MEMQIVESSMSTNALKRHRVSRRRIRHVKEGFPPRLDSTAVMLISVSLRFVKRRIITKLGDERKRVSSWKGAVTSGCTKPSSCIRT
jgi:hypothetical protein